MNLGRFPADRPAHWAGSTLRSAPHRRTALRVHIKVYCLSCEVRLAGTFETTRGLRRRGSEIPSPSQKNLPEGQLRGLLSALLFTLVVKLLGDKNATMEIPRGQTTPGSDI